MDTTKNLQQYLGEDWLLPREHLGKDSKPLLESHGFTILGSTGSYYITRQPVGWKAVPDPVQPDTAEIVNLVDDQRLVRLRLIYSYIAKEVWLDQPTAFQRMWVSLKSWLQNRDKGHA